MVATAHNEGRDGAAARGQGLPARLSFGWKVIAGLAALTAIEFVIAVTLGRSIMAPLIVLIALYKTVVIALYFMHFKQLWQREEH